MNQSNPFIWSKKKALSKTFCKKLVTKFKKDGDKYQGIVGRGNVDKKMKTSTDLAISNKERWEEEDDVLFNSLSSALIPYVEHISKNLDLTTFERMGNVRVDIAPSLCSNQKDTGYQIQETQPGDYYDWHHDGEFHLCPEHANVRKFTYIWYLNEDFDEGETEFYDGTLVKPETGLLVLFPATWTFYHRGRPPKNGKKYICTGWMYDILDKNGVPGMDNRYTT